MLSSRGSRVVVSGERGKLVLTVAGAENQSNGRDALSMEIRPTQEGS